MARGKARPSGHLRPGSCQCGPHFVEGKDITLLPADKIVKLGIGHSPEGRRIFANMSVRENLELGAYTRNDRAGIQQDFDRALTLFPRLKERISQNAGTLSGGEQQMLAMGRALMARPNCSCSMSRRWDWPRFWCGTSFRSSGTSTPREPRCF